MERSSNMKPLPTIFRSDEFDFILFRRNRLVALFQKSKSTHKYPVFEVVQIQELPTREIFGRVVEAHEAMPSSEQWGTYGWSYSDFSLAEKKFFCLLEKLEHGAKA
jgi:hypothetical protein